MCPACIAAILASGAASVSGLWALKGSVEKDIAMKETSTKPKHLVGTRDEWLAARLKLLKAEKEHTRRGDELALMRQDLPWVRIDKDYQFDGFSRRPLPRPFATPCLPPHVRARLQRGLSVLLGDRGRLQWNPSPSGEPRCHALGDIAGAAFKAASVQTAVGMDLPVGIVVRQRLQLRL